MSSRSTRAAASRPSTQRAGEILGLQPERARGRVLEEALAGPQNARLVEAVAVVRDGREESYEAQVVCALPQGRRTLSLVVKALHGEGRRPLGTVVVVEDLTQILATQRLEAWKEAVERVIHEIKNPLTPVGLAGETLKTAWGRDPARFAAVFPSAIDMILGAVRDLKELIGEFSRFSRLPPMRPERLEANQLVLDALEPYTKTPPERVQIKTELAPDAPAVEADADQIKRVLLNVINNALEAMGERGGTLRLSTRSEPFGVLIRVEDDGPGVEDVERIFEPHYTTKVKGTGLGLAIARQIVEEHAGTIRAESQPGRGTSVHIRLPGAAPWAGGATPPQNKESRQRAVSLAASPVLSLVDDEAVSHHVDRRVHRVPHRGRHGFGRVVRGIAGDAVGAGLPHDRLRDCAVTRRSSATRGNRLPAARSSLAHLVRPACPRRRRTSRP